MRSLLILMFISLFHFGSKAQNVNVSIHAYDPLSIWKKAGLKVEVRHNMVSGLITGVQTYNYITGNFGGQVGLECRLYSKVDSVKAHENLFYFRYFEGKQQNTHGLVSFLNYGAENMDFAYYGLGMGVGRKFLFQKLFVDFNIGIKYTIPDETQENSFFITGTGSYLEFHSNFGYKF